MRHFWPIYLITAAVGTAGVYFAAPYVRPFVPAFLMPAPSATQMPGRDVPPLLDETEAAPSTGRNQPAGLTTDHSARPSPAARQDISADELPPALNGIYLAQRGEKPGWGITHQQTAYYNLDGTRAGEVSGGVLLEFHGTRTSSKGGMVTCSLNEENIPATPLLVSVTDIYLFTGDYHKLSQRQLADLKAYYALVGRIAARKKELLQAAAQKNPFFTDYQAKYNTLMAHIEKAKELTVQRDNATGSDRLRSEEKLREMKVAESTLRQEYEAIHQKFRDWKAQHASEVAHPEKDPSILQWTEQRTALIPRIPGLAY